MFRTEALRQRIELINHLIEFGRQVILIQGAPGLGKTTLLHAIEEAADPTWVFIRVAAGPTLNRASLLDKVAQNLDFEPTEKFSEEEVLEEIQRRLQILDNTNQMVVLTIDDAEELPAESYSLLLELAHREDESIELRVVLAADNSESSLHDHLQASANQQAVIHTVDIPRMDREQTASLLSWWQDQELPDKERALTGLFSAATIDEIFEQSNGRPGDILILARQYWLSGQNIQLRRDPVKKYIVMGALALTAIGLLTFFDKDTEDTEISDLKIELPDAETLEPPPSSELTPAPEPNMKSDTPEDSAANLATPAIATDSSIDTVDTQIDDAPPPNGLDSTIADTSKSTPLPLAVDDGLDGMLAAALAEEVISQLDNHTEQSANPNEAGNTTAPDKEPPPVPKQQTEKSDEKRIDATTAESTPKPQPQVKVKLRSKPDQQSETIKSPPAELKLPKKTAPRTTAKAKPAPYTLAHLLRDLPNGYVLQLFGVRDHDAASNYIAKHELQAESAIVASMHEGQPWYVVIHGRFQNRDEAAKAAQSLSQRLSNVKPWPRPVSSLK